MMSNDTSSSPLSPFPMLLSSLFAHSVSHKQSSVHGKLLLLQEHLFLPQAVGFALASDQLNDGLWCRKKLCSDWQHWTICVLIVAEIQWLKRLLVHDGRLEPYPALDPHMLDVFLKSTKCRWQLVAFSELFAEQMPSYIRNTGNVDTLWTVPQAYKLSQFIFHLLC